MIEEQDILEIEHNAMIREQAIKEVIEALMSGDALEDRRKFILEPGNGRTNEYFAEWLRKRFLG